MEDFGISMRLMSQGVDFPNTKKDESLYIVAQRQQVLGRNKLETLANRNPEQHFNIYATVPHVAAELSTRPLFDRYG